MDYMDKVLIIGRVASEVTIKETGNGKTVSNFMVEVTRSWYRNNARHERTTLYKVSAWGNLGVTCNNRLGKGSYVYIEGQLEPGVDGRPKAYQTAGGTWRADYELDARFVLFMDGATQDNNESDQDNGEDYN